MQNSGASETLPIKKLAELQMQCPKCGELIEAGDSIHPTPRDPGSVPAVYSKAAFTWVHEHCAERPPPLCPYWFNMRSGNSLLHVQQGTTANGFSNLFVAA